MVVNCDVISGCIYSCQWKKENYHPSSKNSGVVEKIFFVILFLIFTFGVIWVYCVSVFENDSDEVNWFFFQELGTWFNWYVLVIVISALILAYLFPLFVSGLYHLYRNSLKMSIFHKVFVFVCLAIMIAGMVAISIFYPDVWPLISASFDVTAFFLQLFGVVLWTCFAIYYFLLLRKQSSFTVRTFAYVAYFTVFIFLLTIPLWTKSPCVYQGAFLHQKPILIGHRGAPTLAPENTILSFEKSISKCNVGVLESDVRTSADGIPFLLHDDTLLRTTNVEEVFPARKNDQAETFAWNELQQLNAGEWFLKTNPFLTNGRLSKSEKDAIRLQKIPSLSDYINLAAQNNRSVIFDFLIPSNKEKFIDFYLKLTLDVILNSSLPQQNVIWIRSDDTIELVEKLAPGFRIASPDPPSKGILLQLFNLLFSSVTQNTVSPNRSIISYTINNNWAFTRAWCQGVWAVTTNQCERFQNTAKPSWRLNNSAYQATWITVDILCVIAVITIVLVISRKHSQVSHNVIESLNYSHEPSSDDIKCDNFHTLQTLIL